MMIGLRKAKTYYPRADLENEKHPPSKLPKAGLQRTREISSLRGFKTVLRRNMHVVSILSFGAVLCCVSFVVLIESLKIVNVAKTMRVQGHVQAVEKSEPISHQTGGVVSQVFVTEGEVVREGQILMSLETQDIAEELKAARQTVAGLILNAQCLRALRADENKFTLEESLKQVMGRLQQIKEMRRGILRCQETLDIRKLELATKLNNLRSDGDIFRLNERISRTNILMYQKYASLKENAKDNVEQIEGLLNLRAILEQSIKSAESKKRLSKNQNEFDKNEIDRKSKIDVELEVLSDRLAEAEFDLTRMETLLDDKFVYASSSGRIQRMRIENAGQRIAAGAYVLEVSPLKTDFEVTSRINYAEFPSLKLGHLVQVKLSGGLPKPIWVPGKIDRILKISENKRLVSIRLKREDLNKRDLLLGDHSLNGLGERSDAIISISSETALETLETSFKRMFKFQEVSHQTNI